MFQEDDDELLNKRFLYKKAMSGAIANDDTLG